MSSIHSKINCFLISILISIKWTGFTKNNHLGSGIHCANALPSVIIFIETHNWRSHEKIKVVLGMKTKQNLEMNGDQNFNKFHFESIIQD